MGETLYGRLGQILYRITEPTETRRVERPPQKGDALNFTFWSALVSAECWQIESHQKLLSVRFRKPPVTSSSGYRNSSPKLQNPQDCRLCAAVLSYRHVRTLNFPTIRAGARRTIAARPCFSPFHDRFSPWRWLKFDESAHGTQPLGAKWTHRHIRCSQSAENMFNFASGSSG